MVPGSPEMLPAIQLPFTQTALGNDFPRQNMPGGDDGDRVIEGDGNGREGERRTGEGYWDGENTGVTGGKGVGVLSFEGLKIEDGNICGGGIDAVEGRTGETKVVLAAVREKELTSKASDSRYSGSKSAPENLT